MTLATATLDGKPSARIVLLKGFDERGFVFFTNYESQKGRELSANPQAALVCYWIELERQVRISGRVSRVSVEESEDYFRSRPLGSQLGAWASHQSEVVGGRKIFGRPAGTLTQEYQSEASPIAALLGWVSRSSRDH